MTAAESDLRLALRAARASLTHLNRALEMPSSNLLRVALELQRASTRRSVETLRGLLMAARRAA